MKKLLFTIGFIVALCIGNVQTSAAQAVSVSINIGNQPAWGPAGYDYAGYYYFPDLDIYYDVDNYLFYYLNRGRWISSRYLPYDYEQYDLYNMYKVVINQPSPWRYYRRYRTQYAPYIGSPSPVIILNSPDRRYYSSRRNRFRWVDPNRSGRYYNDDKRYRDNYNHNRHDYDYDNYYRRDYENDRRSSDRYRYNNRERNIEYRNNRQQPGRVNNDAIRSSRNSSTPRSGNESGMSSGRSGRSDAGMNRNTRTRDMNIDNSSVRSSNRSSSETRSSSDSRGINQGRSSSGRSSRSSN